MSDLSAYEIERAFALLGYRGKDRYRCDSHPTKGGKPFSIDRKKGIYYCFYCHKSGSIWKLSKEKTGKTVYELLNISQDKQAFMGQEKEEYKPLLEPPIDIRGVLKPFLSSPEALTYAMQRYIAPEIAFKAGVGYADDVYINGTIFTQRFTIPVFNDKGIMISMEGRDITFQQKPKCLYPKDTIKPLYEWWKLDTTKPLYIVEGLIKLLVLRSDPYFENSSTLHGSAVSDYQLEHLKKFKGGIIVIPDNDDAGGKLAKVIKDKLPLTSVEEMRIKDRAIKDIDEVPERTGKTIKEFRESSGFSNPARIAFE